jgi:small GTP-binding protein
MYNGTLLYMAPEIHNGNDFDFSVDVYAYGILMYSVISGKSPYEGVPIQSQYAFAHRVIGGQRPDIPKDVDKKWKNLMEACWSSSAKRRPTFEDICRTMCTTTFTKSADAARFVFYRDRVTRDSAVVCGGSENLDVKILVVGDAGVNKTSLVERMCVPTPGSDFVSPRIGAAFRTVQLEISEGRIANLQIWNTAGQEKYRNLAPMYYRRAGVVVLVFAVQDRTSFENLSDWLAELESKADKQRHLILVGHHLSVENTRRVVGKEEAESFAIEINTPYCEVCAKTGDGIDGLLEIVARFIREDVAKRATVAADGDSSLDPLKKKYGEKRKHGSESGGFLRFFRRKPAK